MRIKLKSEIRASPALLSAAIAIADPPPDWIVWSLGHFVDDDFGDLPPLGDRLAEVARAVDVLLEWLPAYEHLPVGMQCPPRARVAQRSLRWIKRDLERLSVPQRGPPAHFGQWLCSQVVVECWTQVHGNAEPRSVALAEACELYWVACGGEPIGPNGIPADKWRRKLAEACGGDRHMAAQVISGYRELAVHNSA
jgi:hypothetical protein